MNNKKGDGVNGPSWNRKRKPFSQNSIAPCTMRRNGPDSFIKPSCGSGNEIKKKAHIFHFWTLLKGQSANSIDSPLVFFCFLVAVSKDATCCVRLTIWAARVCLSLKKRPLPWQNSFDFKLPPREKRTYHLFLLHCCTSSKNVNRCDDWCRNIATQRESRAK